MKILTPGLWLSLLHLLMWGWMIIAPVGFVISVVLLFLLGKPVRIQGVESQSVPLKIAGCAIWGFCGLIATGYFRWFLPWLKSRDEERLGRIRDDIRRRNSPVN